MTAQIWISSSGSYPSTVTLATQVTFNMSPFDSKKYRPVGQSLELSERNGTERSKDPPAREITKSHRFTIFFQRTVENWWLLELACATLGTISIVILCIILHHYDGNSVPKFGSVFGHAITLNTVVAILVQLATALLLVPVTECIGQLKWMWYLGKHRPLKDLEVFDKASRDFTGAISLLWKIRWRYVGILR